MLASDGERDERAKGLFGEEHAVFKLFLKDGVPVLWGYSGREVGELTGEDGDEGD